MMEIERQKSIHSLMNFSKFGSNLMESFSIAKFCLEFSLTRKVTHRHFKELNQISISE